MLVLPFDNRTGQANLAWIGDSFPDTLNQRLTSAGFLTITRDDRQYALDHLGLPVDFRPSRATTIRIAQTLDADFVIVGSYTVNNGRIAVQAQVLEVNKLRLSQPLEDSSELTRLFDVENAIAWKIARQIDPHFNVAQQTFLAASGGVRLSAFENYIRGTDATTSQERIKRLQMAIQDTPDYPAALLALGKAQFAQRDYDQAAATLAKIHPTDRRALEANFYIGLARFNSAKYAEAESAFAFVASRLPLPEVVNNQAVASSRQGHDAVPLFQRASIADPNDADYHYNLAVALLRRGDFAGAQHEVDQTLKLRPTDTEAAELKASISAGRHIAPADKGGRDNRCLLGLRTARTHPPDLLRSFLPPGGLPARPDASHPHGRASTRRAGRAVHTAGPRLSRPGPGSRGRTGVPGRHRRRLLQCRCPRRPCPGARTQRNPADARAEAQTSLNLHPNVPAYLVLARLDLQANEITSSASNVSKALQLEPKDSAALGMRQALQARGQSLP